MRPKTATQTGTIILIILLSQMTYAQSEKTYERVCERNTVRAYKEFLDRYPGSEYELDAYQRLAWCYTAASAWGRAVTTYQHLGTVDRLNLERYNAIIDILEAPADSVEIRNLGPQVNTKYSEYAPVITADGKTLYFCIDKRERLNIDSISARIEELPPLERLTEALKVREMMSNSGREEIWKTRNVDGHWATSTDVGIPLNSDYSDAMEAVSVNNTEAIIFRNGRLMTSELDSRGSWSSPSDMGELINSGEWDGDACLSGDGRALFYVSSRDGSIPDTGDGSASKDLYVTVRKNGRWSEPVNLGKRINTAGEERTPFLHSDGKTLYFSSNGHPGLGGHDVFRSVRQGDTWTDWSAPENLGREINTPGDDWGYKLPASGDQAFYSISGRSDGYGGYDIYVVDLPTDIQPALAVTAIRGTITDQEGNPLQAKVIWEYLGDAEAIERDGGRPVDDKNQEVVTIGEASSNPVTGEYHITLPAGKKYVYYASKEGYYPTSQNIDLRDRDQYDEVSVNIVLGENTVELRNVFFDFDRASLRRESRSELQRLVTYMKQNPSRNIEISGHTDDIGPEPYNLDLSQRRANSVVKYLVDHGITKSRLNAKGYGYSKPVDTSLTDEGRAKNRRVEFHLLP